MKIKLTERENIT